ncbi:MAG: hypothetical protein QHD01_11050 [Bradyrhizobium sp.]|nr:hypothetical protein [Bradyrhizobium sp.]
MRPTADSQSDFGPWHLADLIASPLAGPVAPQDGYTIRYRVL